MATDVKTLDEMVAVQKAYEARVATCAHEWGDPSPLAREFGRECTKCKGLEVHVLRSQLARIRQVAEVDRWDDELDEWTPAIEEAFPSRSGSHEEYAIAMRMVGNRRSKRELAALVNWLLVRNKK